MLTQRLAELTKKPKVLTWDIETSPAIVYSWGLFGQDHSTSQIIEPSRVLCFASKWLDRKACEFYSEFHDGRADMIAQAWRLLDEADIVISYNGIGFDTKHMNREFLLAGFTPCLLYTSPSPRDS